MPSIDVSELASAIRDGSRAHLARAITLIESSRADHRATAIQLLQEVSPWTGTSNRVGISGVPGAGKSTFIDALGTMLVGDGQKVAVLAIDPSSTRTGGSILGDRTRMSRIANEPNVFIRPSPSGGHLGGVARATRETMLLCEAAGYDTVIVETVGVGQSEVAVAGMVDTFLLLHLAGSGDQLQGIKRGILELADVIAVNKADGDNAGPARVAARDLSIAMKLISSTTEDRRPPVLTCSAYTGDGIRDVWNAICEHRQNLVDDGELDQQRIDQQRQWLQALIDDSFRVALRRSPAVLQARAEVEQGMSDGTVGALEGSQQILEALRSDLMQHPFGEIGLS